jgi:hypothetical protein
MVSRPRPFYVRGRSPIVKIIVMNEILPYSYTQGKLLSTSRLYQITMLIKSAFCIVKMRIQQNIIQLSTYFTSTSVNKSHVREPLGV